MRLTEQQQNKIKEILDSDEFINNLYAGLSEEGRVAKGQFYTPAKVCIQMLEKYECDSFAGKTILDPTCGSGNLLIAMLIAGADSDKLFGNEYDAIAVELCRKRLNRACDILCVPHINDWQIHQGNALQKRCLVEFTEDYITGGNSGCHYNPKYIDDMEYAQSNNNWRWENERANKRAKIVRDAQAYKTTSLNWGDI